MWDLEEVLGHMDMFKFFSGSQVRPGPRPNRVRETEDKLWTNYIQKHNCYNIRTQRTLVSTS